MAMDEGPHFLLAHQLQPAGSARDPAECLREGVWMVEPIYYATGSGATQRKGRAYKAIDTGDFVCFEAHDGTQYNIGGRCLGACFAH
jgi:hypothetical protein